MTAGIIGATGYAGVEIARILAAHPEVTKILLSSSSAEGSKLNEVYPNFLANEKLNSKFLNANEVIENSSVVFAALPNGVSEDFAEACFNKGVPFIDMAASFRFDTDEETYSAWYGLPFKHKELHQHSIYGLPELNREKIKAAGKRVIIGNPGCYPTCSSLAAFPALKMGAAGEGTIIIDAASGITGGGREPVRAFHFPECYDSFTPYKIGSHRHTPEISRNFSFMEGLPGGEGVGGGVGEGGSGGKAARHIVFTPHLSPMNRGIVATLYIPLAEKYKNSLPPANGRPRPRTKKIEESAAEIRELYRDFYKDEHFVRLLPAGSYAAANRVRLSNFCDIAVDLDQSGAILIISATIDNMVKGAAGQAVQNMNIIFGYPEDEGLNQVPALF